MNRITCFLLAAFLCAALLPADRCLAQEGGWKDIGEGNTRISAVLVSADDPQLLYFANALGVFKRQGIAHPWQRVLAITASRQKVNRLVFGADRKHTVYAAFSNGLFRTTDAGGSWQKIFDPPSGSREGCTALAESGNVVFVGTGRGLYYSLDGCRHWTKAQGIPASGLISSLVVHPQQTDTLFCAAADEVWRTDDQGKSWGQVFSGGHTQEESEEGVAESSGEEGAGSVFVRAIEIDPRSAQTVYLATERGVLVSRDRGDHWDRLAQQGLLDRDVQSVRISLDSRVFALAGDRIFEYANERWRDVSVRLVCGSIRDFAVVNSSVYAACEQGLFMSAIDQTKKPLSDSNQTLNADQEPTISQVQRAAIRYAEVEPEKIISWRKQAAHKAWLPEFSVGLNNDISDFRHWEGGSTTRENDDLLRKGKQALEWDVSLQWDLGELLWNPDQTSIDTRSRLMVELRNDIVDQVTKLYFERLKVKAELEGCRPEEDKKRREKELRLMELTAYIDGLTGGYFSRASASNCGTG